MDKKMTRQPAWVLLLHGRYGDSCYVFASEDELKKAHYSWIDMNWDLCAGVPQDYDQAVHEYYDFYAGESFKTYGTMMQVSDPAVV